MRCRACDAPVEGERELCGGCGRVSRLYANNPHERAPEKHSDNLFFGIMVKRYDLGTSWRDGALGTMHPEARYRHMHDRALAAYRDNRKVGMSQYMAFTKATGVANRGNQRFTMEGTKRTKAPDSGGGGQGGTGTTPARWGETVSYEFL